VLLFQFEANFKNYFTLFFEKGVVNMFKYKLKEWRHSFLKYYIDSLSVMGNNPQPNKREMDIINRQRVNMGP